MTETETLTDNSPGLILRDSRETDFPFIFNSWVQSYRRAEENRSLPYTYYKERQAQVIYRLLRRPHTAVKVVCLADDTDTLLGWICYERLPKTRVIHYIYVKKGRDGGIRRNGIGTALCDAAGIDLAQPIITSHYTYVVDQLREAGFTIAFHPELRDAEANNG